MGIMLNGMINRPFFSNTHQGENYKCTVEWIKDKQDQSNTAKPTEQFYLL